MANLVLKIKSIFIFLLISLFIISCSKNKGGGGPFPIPDNQIKNEEQNLIDEIREIQITQFCEGIKNSAGIMVKRISLDDFSEQEREEASIHYQRVLKGLDDLSIKMKDYLGTISSFNLVDSLKLFKSEFEEISKNLEEIFSILSKKRYENYLLEVNKVKFNVQDHLIGNYMGDDFIGNSGLEGLRNEEINDLLSIRNQLIHAYKNSINHQKNGPYLPANEELDFCRGKANQLCKILERVKTTEIVSDFDSTELEQVVKEDDYLFGLTKNVKMGNLIDFSSLYERAVNDLDKGLITEIPIDITWVGHAIKIAIHKNGEKDYRIRIYNSGQGIDHYHQKLSFGFRDLYLPYVERGGASKSDIAGKFFQSALFGIQNAKKIKMLTMNTFYNDFLMKLNFTGETGGASLIHGNRYWDVQKSGSCGGYIMTYSQFGSSLKRNLLQNLTKWAMVDRFFNLSTITKKNAEKKTAFGELALKNIFARERLREGKGKGDLGFIRFLAEQVDHYSTILSNWEKIYLDDLSQDKANLNFKPSNDYYQNINADFIRNGFNPPTDSSVASDLNPLPIVKEGFHDLEDIEPYIRKLSEYTDSNLFSNKMTRPTLETFAFSLDLNPEFWINSIIETKEYLNLIRRFQFMVRGYLGALLTQKGDTTSLSSREVLTHLSFLTAGQLLINGYHLRPDKDYKNEEKISLYHKHLNDLLNGSYSSFFLITEEERIHFEKIKSFWRKELANTPKDKLDTFDFELMPPGTVQRSDRSSSPNAVIEIYNDIKERKASGSSNWNLGIGKILPTDFKFHKWLIAENNLHNRCSNLTNMDCLKKAIKEGIPSSINSIYSMTYTSQIAIFQDLKKPYSNVVSDITIEVEKDRVEIKDPETGEILYPAFNRLKIYNDFSVSQKSTGSELAESIENVKLYDQLIVRKPSYSLDSIFDDELEYLAEVFRSYSFLDNKLPSRHRIHVNSNESVKKKLPRENSKKMSYESFREVLNLSGNEQRQLIETISYFKKNPHLLSEKKYQNIFLSLIFYNNVLKDEVSRSTQMPYILHDFCDDIFKLYFDKEHGEEIIPFILYINGILGKNLRSINPDINKDKKLKNFHFKSSEDIFERVIGKVDGENTEFLSAIYAYYLLNIKNVKEFESENEFKLFVRASFYLEIFPLTNNSRFEISTLTKYNLENIYQEKIASVYKWIDELDKTGSIDKVLNEIINYLIYSQNGEEGEEEDTWERSKRYNKKYLFENKTASIIVDFNSAHLIVNGKTRTSLPNKILTNKVISSIINLNQYLEIYSYGDYYLIKDLKGNQYYFSDSWQNGQSFYKLFHDEWYQLHQSNVVKELDDSSHYYYWKFVKKEGQDNLTSKKLFEENEENYGNKTLYKVVATDKNNLEAKYVVYYNSVDQTVKSYYLVENGKETTYQRMKLDDSNALVEGKSFQFLKQIENPTFIYIWLSKDRKIYKIELPRLGLNLVANEEEFVCPEMGNLKISKNQKVPGYDNLENFIVFEDERGNKKALFSKISQYEEGSILENPEEMKKYLEKKKEKKKKEEKKDEEQESKKSKLKKSLKMEKIGFSKDLNHVTTFSFDYDSNSKKLIPQSLGGQIYLSFLKALTLDFKGAKEILSEKLGLLGKFTQQETYLGLSLALADIFHTNTPELAGYKMMLANIIFRSEFFFGGEDQVALSIILTCYKSYLSDLNLIGEGNWLDFEDESLLLSYYLDFVDKGKEGELYNLLIERQIFLQNAQFLSGDGSSNRNQENNKKRDDGNRSSSLTQPYSVDIEGVLAFSSLNNPNNYDDLKFILEGQEILKNFDDLYYLMSIWPKRDSSKIHFVTHEIMGEDVSSWSDDECYDFVFKLLDFLKKKTGSCTMGNPAYFLKEKELKNNKDLLTHVSMFLIDYVKLNSNNPPIGELKAKGKKIIDLAHNLEYGKYKKDGAYKDIIAGHNQLYEFKANYYSSETRVREIIDADTDLTHKDLETFSKTPKKEFNFKLVIDTDNVDQYTLKQPLLDAKKQEKIFEKRPRIAKNKEKLEDIYHVKGHDEFYNEKIGEFNRHLDDYLGSYHQKYDFKIRDLKSLQTEMDNIAIKYKKLQDEVNGKWEDLLENANQLPSEKNSRLDEMARRVNGETDELTKKDLLVLVAQNKESFSFSQYSYLSLEDVKKIHQTSFELILKESYLNFLKRSLDLWKELRKVGPDNVNAINDLGQVLETVRSYDIKSFPQLLVFEYINNVVLRQDQFDSFNKLIESQGTDKGVLLEAVMGSGKTFFLLPMVASQMANGENLSVITIPENLIPSMIQSINQTIKGVTGKEIDLLEFNRGTKFNNLFLKTIYDRLENGRKNGRVFMMSNGSILSLYLKFIEKIHYGVDDEDLAYFQKIFNLFKKHGNLLIDEVDLIFDSRHEHIFSMNQGEGIAPDISTIVSELYSFILKNSKIRDFLTIPFLKNISKGGKAFTDDNYEEFKVLFIDEMIKSEAFLEGTKLHYFYRFLDKKLMKDYLLGIIPYDDMLSKVKNVESKNILTILYDELNTVLPLTLNKKLGMHYGGIEEEKFTSFAIPYHLGVPATKSRFATELEFINYTLQLHIEQNEPFSMLKEEVDRLKKSLQGANDQKEKIIKKRFKYLVGGSGSYELATIKDDGIKSIADNIKANPERNVGLIKSSIIPKIKVYPELLKTNSQVFSFLFQRVQGISGTLWNTDSFPSVYRKIYPSDTDARSSYALWNGNSDPIKTYKSEGLITAKVVVDEILTGCQSDRCSVIDLGGSLTEFNNDETAYHILHHPVNKSNKEVYGIIYYNDEGKIVVMDRARNILDKNQSTIKKENLIAYWDLARTTGSDLKLRKTMKAMMTLSKYSIDRDVKQAAWRLRGLESGQSVSFVLTKNDATYMCKVLKTELDIDCQGKLSKENALRFFKINEFKELGKLNHNAMKHKFKKVYIKNIFGKLLELSGEACRNLLNSTFGFFKTTRPNEIYLRFGRKVETKNKEIVINEEINEIKSSHLVKKFFDTGYFNDLKDKIANELLKIKERIKNKLQTFLELVFGYEKEVEVEQEEENEQENDRENEQEKEMNIEYENFDVETIKTNIISDSLLYRSCYQPKDVHYSDYHIDRYFGRDLNFSCRFSSLNNSLSNQGKFKDELKHLYEANLFPKNLLISFNGDPRYYAKTHEYPSYIFSYFSGYAKVIHEAFMAYDKSRDEVYLVLVDPDDAEDLTSYIESINLGKNSLIGDISWMGIINFGLGIVISSDMNQDEEILARPDTKELVTKAKFFTGEIEYTHDELLIIKDWYQDRGLSTIRDLFERNVLKTKFETKKNYEETILYKLFNNPE